MAKRKSELEKYLTKVHDGKVVACAKMRRLSDNLLNDISSDKGQWHFSAELAERACSFIETFCKIPSGRIGQPLVLEDYEKAIIQATFGFVDDDNLRRFIEVLVIIARKNGKSTLAAAIELYMLIADGEGSPQIYNVATNAEQAALCYNACIKMMRQSGEISRHVRKQTDRLYCADNMGFIKPLSSNTQSLDGLDVHLAVIDELAAIKNRDLYDLVKQGMSAREQPLLFTITTNGFIRNGIFDAQYEYAAGVLEGKVKDKRFLPFIFELDDRDEWDDEKMWVKANPGLGTVKKKLFLKSNVQKAKDDPTFRATVLTKDFNLPENSSVAWLTFEEAVNEETFGGGLDATPEEFKKMGFRYGVVGFDASDTVDLTCAQMLMMRPGDDKIYERSMYWIPEDVILNDMENGRKERDGVPYQLWISRGLLRTVPGNKIDKRVLVEWLSEMRDVYDVYTYAVGYDPWHMTDDYARTELEGFVGKQRCFQVRQGAQTLSQPMKQIKSDYRAKRIVDNHNPLNEWCRMNLQVKTDVNGNIQPDKKNADARNRIDGFAAELDAYVILDKLFDDYVQNC